MSEQGDLNQAIAEEGGTEQETATPENGIVKSESLDEEEKLELQVSEHEETLTLIQLCADPFFYFQNTLKIYFLKSFTSCIIRKC